MPERRPSNHLSRDDAAIEKTASNWIARIDRGLSPQDATQFAAWKAADPRHAAELARLSATWRSLDTTDEVPEIMHSAQELEKIRRRSPLIGRWGFLVATFGAAAAIILWSAK